MIRYLLFAAALFTMVSSITGCGDSENRTVETQGELWDERAAFYANESNFEEEVENYEDEE